MSDGLSSIRLRIGQRIKEVELRLAEEEGALRSTLRSARSAVAQAVERRAQGRIPLPGASTEDGTVPFPVVQPSVPPAPEPPVPDQPAAAAATAAPLPTIETEVRERAVLEQCSRLEEGYKSEVKRLQLELAESLSREAHLTSVLQNLREEIKREPFARPEEAAARTQDLERVLRAERGRVGELERQLKERDAKIGDLVKSTAHFLDAALKDEQNRISGLADKAARVLFEKKEFERQLRDLTDEHRYVADKLEKKEKVLREVLDKNAALKEQIRQIQVGLHVQERPAPSDERQPDTHGSHPAQIVTEIPAAPKPADMTGPADDAHPFPASPDDDALRSQRPQAAASGPIMYEHMSDQETQSIFSRFVGWLGKPMVRFDA